MNCNGSGNITGNYDGSSYVRDLTLTDIDKGFGGNSKPLLIDFWAEWCGPCKAVKPIFEQLAKEHSELCDFARFDFDLIRKTEDKTLAKKVSELFSVVSLPTFLMIKDDQVIGKVTGMKTAEELHDFMLDSLDPSRISELSLEEKQLRLLSAIQSGSLEQVKALIAKGLDLKEPVRVETLSKAAIFGGTEPSKLDDLYPVQLASIFLGSTAGHAEIFTYLLEAMPDLDVMTGKDEETSSIRDTLQMQVDHIASDLRAKLKHLERAQQLLDKSETTESSSPRIVCDGDVCRIVK